MRDVERPYTYLVKHGFSANLAHRITKNDIKTFSLEHLEKICRLMKCTPHDLLEWTPNNEKEDYEGNPLRILKKEYKYADVKNLIKDLPFNQLEELAELIAKKKKE